MSVERIHREVNEIMLRMETEQRVHQGQEDMYTAIVGQCWCNQGVHHESGSVCPHCLGRVR
ncbi:hypothetical protein LCGC14_2187740 [marine sediment metagenome]|uniref:Uncharacterized protein n=1 Tax=marine sediment metagenome TaxID=412755 RepID=A0A0F9GG57_9ZZZZ